MTLSSEQKIQENQYDFPYHYIPQFEGNFTQHVSWSWGVNYCATIEFLIKKISNKKFNTLADIGTGDGRLVRELSKAFPEKIIEGIDYSDQAISLAKALNTQLSFKQADITKLKDDKFDLITLIEVFEHIPMELCHDFVFGLKNLLTDDGRILLTVPHKNKPLSEKHFQHFTKDSIMEYFSEFFNIVEYQPIDKISRFVRYLKKISNNKYFLVQYPKFNNYLYSVVKKNYVNTNETNCGRIYLELILKQ